VICLVITRRTTFLVLPACTYNWKPEFNSAIQSISNHRLYYKLYGNHTFTQTSYISSSRTVQNVKTTYLLRNTNCLTTIRKRLYVFLFFDGFSHLSHAHISKPYTLKHVCINKKRTETSFPLLRVAQYHLRHPKTEN
jgi:hypothetical protein